MGVPEFSHHFGGADGSVERAPVVDQQRWRQDVEGRRLAASSGSGILRALHDLLRPARARLEALHSPRRTIDRAMSTQ